MLESLKPGTPDPILAVLGLYREDPRPHKLDLGIGVFKDHSGNTPIPKAVKAAERRLLEQQASKAYVGMAGDLAYNEAIKRVVFGDLDLGERCASLQTAGGSGAIRLMGEMLNASAPGARVWLPGPTWPNHAPTLATAGLSLETYPYFDFGSQSLLKEQMFAALAKAGKGEIVLLHGCCHNPTGADLELEDWHRLTDMALAQGFLPFIDLAYQGFGLGLEADAAGLRHMASNLPEMLISASCSKNFGLYRDRIGAAILIGSNAASTSAMRDLLISRTRLAVSMPPAHGAEVVREILSDAALEQSWREEVEAMRLQIQGARQALADQLRSLSNSDRFDFIAQQRGMFSTLGISAEQVACLRDEHAIYLVGNGRMNLAGLRADQAEPLARGLLAVMNAED